MNETQKIFLNLISASLTGTKNDTISELDTQMVQELETLARQNACFSIMCEMLAKNNINIPQTWKNVSSFVVLDSFRKLSVETEILSLLKKNGIRACVLKGSTVAVNYPNPLSRALGDVDILVDSHNYQKASLIFVSQEEYEKNEHEFHIGFNYKNVRIEIHKYITDDYSERHELQSVFDSALDNITYISYENHTIPSLSPAHQAVSLLSHMIRHIRDNEFIFRMFVDWVCFVEKTSKPIWEETVYPLLKLSKLNTFADALNKTASIYLKLNLSDKIYTNVDDELCGLIIEEFFAGNRLFNSRSTSMNIAAIMAKRRHEGNRLDGFIGAINDIARAKYSIARYSFLLPLLWIYIPVKYIFNTIIGKRKAVNFKTIQRASERKTKIFEATQIKL